MSVVYLDGLVELTGNAPAVADAGCAVVRAEFNAILPARAFAITMFRSEGESGVRGRVPAVFPSGASNERD
eukprot:6202336-Pleurochrysis_carterae.AAC.1